MWFPRVSLDIGVGGFSVGQGYVSVCVQVVGVGGYSDEQDR